MTSCHGHPACQVSVSVTLDPRKLEDLDSSLSALTDDLGQMARVSSRNDLAIISLICNVEKTSIIMRETFEVSCVAQDHQQAMCEAFELS